MENNHRIFIDKMAIAAENAEHIFPVAAACEAALESGFGLSSLAIKDFNLFGMKQHSHPVFTTVVLPTKEFIGGEWITVNAKFVQYPDYAACFEDRMATLEELSHYKGFEHYQRALDAWDSEEYVTEVSAKWSTDPKRANKVLQIMSDYLRIA